MRAGDYLSGRVHGRRVAAIAYADPSLDDAARQAKLAVAAAQHTGEALAGYWRGAREIRESGVPQPAASSAEAGASQHIAPSAGTPEPQRSWIGALVAALSLLLAGFVAASTAARHWHPSQLAVYAGCLGYAVGNGWWLPVRLNRAATPRAEALWSLAVVAGFFGGLAGLATLAQLR